LHDGVAIETTRISDLDASERARWAQLRRANPLLGGPYFDLRYADVAGEHAPSANVAVIRRAGEIIGFLPFQRRGGVLQPLAAPITDFHGLIAAPDADLDLTAIVRSLGGERMRFSGLIDHAGGKPGLSMRRAMAADLSKGFEAYEAARPANFRKDKRRRRRALERDHGPLTFSLERPSSAMLDQVITGKRRQLHRTHQYDIFACGWTGTLLHSLAQVDAADFGLRLAVLRAGDVTVAAELGLVSGDRYHLWFPIYDPAYARYSPGSLMTLDTLRIVAALGITRVDFGPGEEAYKADFADPVEATYEGLLHVRPTSAAELRRLPGMGRLSRRFDNVLACEPGLIGRVRGASSFVTAMTRRHPRLGATIGLGVGLGLGLALLD
jgi:CelD/BcsL family acetyltransferase involved in cellulose biosynthesis